MSVNNFHIFGLIGTGIIVSSIIFTALCYRGKDGERFSLLNHFISELGEVGVSSAAWIFNCGLIVGGLALIPYLIKLGAVFGSVLGWLGAAAGIVAVLGVTAVGIFPMNNLHAHGLAAMTYFRAGLVMVVFFGLAILFQPAGHIIVPKIANIFSFLAFAAYAAFLLLMTPKKSGDKPDEDLDPEQAPERPRVWLLALVEWLVFITTISWFFGMTFQI